MKKINTVYVVEEHVRYADGVDRDQRHKPKLYPKISTAKSLYTQRKNNWDSYMKYTAPSVLGRRYTSVPVQVILILHSLGENSEIIKQDTITPP